jgi:V/A-type H+-transporting ATPase subunit C
MALMNGISASYYYVCTRMRVRRSKLIPRPEYMRMLNMSLPEITRIIQETAFKKEIDELGTTFKGIDLIEIALSWNLAKEYQKIQEITPGTLKEFTRSYLRRWDIQNILTILRGRAQGEKTGRIKEVLVPAGSLDRAMLDRFLAEESTDQIIEALKGHPMYPVIAGEYPKAKETGSFSRMENELYKQYYAEMISEAKSGLKGGNLFLDYIRLDIDVKNIKTLFRLRADAIEVNPQEMWIAGGVFTQGEFVELNKIRDQGKFIDALKEKIHQIPLLALLNELKGARTLRDIEVRLTRFQIDQMELMSKMNPFSIHPILAYLEKKKYEVFNLRAIARGKQSNLPAERIAEYLVV